MLMIVMKITINIIVDVLLLLLLLLVIEIAIAVIVIAIASSPKIPLDRRAANRALGGCVASAHASRGMELGGGESDGPARCRVRGSAAAAAAR